MVTKMQACVYFAVSSGTSQEQVMLCAGKVLCGMGVQQWEAKGDDTTIGQVRETLGLDEEELPLPAAMRCVWYGIDDYANVVLVEMPN